MSPVATSNKEAGGDEKKMKENISEIRQHNKEKKSSSATTSKTSSSKRKKSKKKNNVSLAKYLSNDKQNQLHQQQQQQQGTSPGGLVGSNIINTPGSDGKSVGAGSSSISYTYSDEDSLSGDGVYFLPRKRSEEKLKLLQQQEHLHRHHHNSYRGNDPYHHQRGVGDGATENNRLQPWIEGDDENNYHYSPDQKQQSLTYGSFKMPSSRREHQYAYNKSISLDAAVMNQHAGEAFVQRSRSLDYEDKNSRGEYYQKQNYINDGQAGNHTPRRRANSAASSHREEAVARIRGQQQDVTCKNPFIVFLFVLQLLVVIMLAITYGTKVAVVKARTTSPSISKNSIMTTPSSSSSSSSSTSSTITVPNNMIHKEDTVNKNNDVKVVTDTINYTTSADVADPSENYYDDTIGTRLLRLDALGSIPILLSSSSSTTSTANTKDDSGGGGDDGGLGTTAVSSSPASMTATTSNSLNRNQPPIPTTIATQTTTTVKTTETNTTNATTTTTETTTKTKTTTAPGTTSSSSSSSTSSTSNTAGTTPVATAKKIASDKATEFTIDYHNVLSLCMITGFYSCIISIVTVGFMLIISKSLIVIILIFVILLSLAWFIIGLSLHGLVQYIIPLLGFVIFVVLLVYTFVVWDRISFASCNLNVALKAISCTADITILGICFLLVTFIWCGIWSTAFSGIVDSISTTECMSSAASSASSLANNDNSYMNADTSHEPDGGGDEQSNNSGYNDNALYDENVYDYDNYTIGGDNLLTNTTTNNTSSSSTSSSSIIVNSILKDCKVTGEDLTYESYYVMVYVFLFFSFVWTNLVLKSIVEVTVSSAVGTWWFDPYSIRMPCCTSAVRQPLVRSLTTSLGPICVGSLILIPNQIANAIGSIICCLIHPSQSRNEHNNGEHLKQLHLTVQNDLSRSHSNGSEKEGGSSEKKNYHRSHFEQWGELMVKINEFCRGCNHWSFTYIGLYSYGFLDGGRKAMDLFDTREWIDVVSDNLIYNVLLMSSIVIGGSAGIFGVLVEEVDGYMLTSFHKPIITAFVIGSTLGFVLSNILLLGIVNSAVNAVLVCFAAGPYEFHRNHPQLSMEMINTWSEQVWEEEKQEEERTGPAV